MKENKIVKRMTSEEVLLDLVTHLLDINEWYIVSTCGSFARKRSTPKGVFLFWAIMGFERADGAKWCMDQSCS